MTLELIGLGKLLRMMYADRAEQVRLLRGNIRETIRKENGFLKAEALLTHKGRWKVLAFR